MSLTVSVSVRSLAVTAALVVVVALAYALGSSGRDGSAAQASAAQAATQAATPASTSPPRTITMSGSGDAVGVPDQLSFRLSVGSTAADVSTAMDQANGTMSRVVASLRKHGVEKKDVETTGLSINPQYRYSDNQAPVLTGYQVRQSVTVLVRSLRAGGRAVSDAIAAGGPYASPGCASRSASGTTCSPRPATRRSRRPPRKGAAVRRGDRSSLREASTLREVSATPRAAVNELNLSMDRAYAAKAVPIQAGSEQLDVEVAIVWELG